MDIPVHIRRSPEELRQWLYMHVFDERERNRLYEEFILPDPFPAPMGANCNGVGYLDDCVACRPKTYRKATPAEQRRKRKRK